jgi:DNA-binding Lrp family transcriptional regulator
MFDDKEKDLKSLSVLQKPLRFESRPFEHFAKQLGIDETQTIELIKEYISRGVIRRFAGIVKHDRIGYRFNAMVAFQVECEKCDDAGEILSKFPYITHCYRRSSYPDWPYNLYAMIHARDQKELEQRINEVKDAISFVSVTILPTLHEFKKSYFQIPTDDKGLIE